MRQAITFTVAFILAAAVTSIGQPLNNAVLNANSKPAELLAGIEAANAIARLGELSSAALRERLQQRRPLDYRPGTVQKIVAAQRLPVVTNKDVDQLKLALQPVLDYHGRSQLPIYVLRADQPKAYLVDRAVIIITTRLLMRASVAELRGIIAHELAHEYLWADRFQAFKAKHWSMLRECELFCDAVAVFTMQELGDDPASYVRMLERLTLAPIVAGIVAGNTTRYGTDTHPSLDARKKLIAFLCQRLNAETAERCNAAKSSSPFC